MPMVATSKVQAISQAVNPKSAILKAVGDLSKEKVLYDLVLVGTYIRPEKTSGGIIRPLDNVREDEFQGKVGLVLQKGPLAGPNAGSPFDEEIIEEGDWIVYSIKDGWAVTVNGAPCRLVPYDRIRMKISDPSVVF